MTVILQTDDAHPLMRKFDNGFVGKNSFIRGVKNNFDN